MPLVIVAARITGHSIEGVYDRVADFARYPELVETVRSVEVGPAAADGSVSSSWSVVFRNGVLRWREKDWFDRERLVIRFEQTEGEFDVFHGDWRMGSGPDGIHLRFQADFDFGVASLAPIIDPVAIRVLTESMQTILTGLFGPESVRFASSVPAVES